MSGGPDLAGAELLRRRLEAYARYAALLEQQEAAADAGEFDRIDELGVQLDALETAIGSVPVPVAASPEVDPESARLRDQVQAELERAASIQQRVARKLRDRLDHTRSELRGLDGRSEQVRTYLDRDGRSPAGRLDLKF